MPIDPTPMVWMDYDPKTGIGDPSTPSSAASLNRITAEVASEVEERIARARVLTLAADSATYALKGGFDARVFGAVGDGIADDTAALNAMNAAAKAAGGRSYMPPGTYKTSATVTFSAGVDAADGATISYFGSGTAVAVGALAYGANTSDVRFNLPRVSKGDYTTTWDANSIGVDLRNALHCEVWVPFVELFAVGLRVYGDGAGCAYNTITLGRLWVNHCNLWVDAAAVGYSNQNLFLGGRLHQTLIAGSTNEDTAAYQLRIGSAIDVPNNNTFVNTSLEGDNPAFYRLWVNGRYNQFINCRWECIDATQSRVYWGDMAHSNRVIGGYEASKLVATSHADAYANSVEWEVWQSYDCAPANLTLGTGGVLKARWAQVGRQVRGHVDIQLGTGGAITANLSIQLPTERYAAAVNLSVGDAYMVSGSNRRRWTLGASTAVSRSVNIIGSETGALVNATTPWTWAAGATIGADFNYEAL